MYLQEGTRVQSELTPRVNINKRFNTQSAKQLPAKIVRGDDSSREESPEALPKHNMPPTSYVDARSSILQSEVSNLEGYSFDDNRFRYSAEPHGARSRIFNKNKSNDNAFNRNKEGNLKDYLKEKFRPPSDSRSAENDASVKSLNNSKNHKTPSVKPTLKHQIVSFGRPNPNHEYSFNDMNNSSSLEQYSNEKYNFMDKFSDQKSTKKLNFRNSFGNHFDEDSQQRARDQAAFRFEKIPKYQLGYQPLADQAIRGNKFLKSSYMDMQDVIDEKSKVKIRHKGL